MARPDLLLLQDTMLDITKVENASVSRCRCISSVCLKYELK